MSGSASPLDPMANAKTIEAMKKSGPIAGSPLFSVRIEHLVDAGTKLTCASAADLRRRAATPVAGPKGDETSTVGLFWESKDSPAQFIYYQIETRLLIVCDGTHVASTILSDSGMSSREEFVKFDEPHFGDWARDGNFEFTFFRGQCIDGPCVGLFHVFQIAGASLKQLAEINADAVDTTQSSIEGKSRTSLEIQASCYTTDFVPAFEYVAVLDFGGPSVFLLVPPQQVRARSPELLKRIGAPEAIDPDASPAQVAFVKMQHVISDAYQGKSLANLKREYAEILSAIPGLRKGDPPPVQCDPMAILTMISESK